MEEEKRREDLSFQPMRAGGEYWRSRLIQIHHHYDPHVLDLDLDRDQGQGQEGENVVTSLVRQSVKRSERRDTRSRGGVGEQIG